jgi:hypothetical protein
MVYGNPAAEEIQLNEETVSAGSPYKNYNPEAKGALATIRQLIFADRYPEAQELAGEKILSKNGFGMPYQTVGSLRLDFPGHENYINFRRELDLEKAVATTAYTVNGVDYKREVFTSFVDQLVIVRLTASQPGKLQVAIFVRGVAQTISEAPLLGNLRIVVVSTFHRTHLLTLLEVIVGERIDFLRIGVRHLATEV